MMLIMLLSLLITINQLQFYRREELHYMGIVAMNLDLVNNITIYILAEECHNLSVRTSRSRRLFTISGVDMFKSCLSGMHLISCNRYSVFQREYSFSVEL